MPLLKKLFALSGVAVLSYSLATLPRIYAVDKIASPAGSLLNNNNAPALMAPLPKRSSSTTSSSSSTSSQQPLTSSSSSINLSNKLNNNYNNTNNSSSSSNSNFYEIRVGTSSLSDELHQPADDSTMQSPDLLKLYARAYFKSPAFKLERLALYPELTDEQIDSFEFRKGEVLFGNLKVLERNENEMLLEWKTNKYSVNLAGTAYFG